MLFSIWMRGSGEKQTLQSKNLATNKKLTPGPKNVSQDPLYSYKQQHFSATTSYKVEIHKNHFLESWLEIERRDFGSPANTRAYYGKSFQFELRKLKKSLGGFRESVS